LATFETTDLAQMRRCRGAQLHGGTVREAFQIAGERVPAAGYVHAIRPDFTSSPLRWTIVIEAEKTTLRPDRAERPRSPTMTAVGTNRTSGDVRSSVANGGKPDIAGIAQFGRE
jgi:hypothetical protein